jgi:hypothetical protein
MQPYPSEAFGSCNPAEVQSLALRCIMTTEITIAMMTCQWEVCS